MHKFDFPSYEWLLASIVMPRHSVATYTEGEQPTTEPVADYLASSADS